jgi:hypothetical protein
VQIGKEGWDCRSLTGIILSQEGDCKQNMVLQTSCRCLRQVAKGSPETALIYLNEGNAKLLNEQLGQQHRISLKEFENGGRQATEIKRYDRTAHLKLPPVSFYQLKVQYETQTLETADPAAAIPAAARHAEIGPNVTVTQDFATGAVTGRALDDAGPGREHATFMAWLYGIAKGGLGFVPMEWLNEQKAPLRGIFDAITEERDGARYYSPRFDRAVVEANIRKAFYDRRICTSMEELVSQEARLLRVECLTSLVSTTAPGDYYPGQETVEAIVKADAGAPDMDLDRPEGDALAGIKALAGPDAAARLKRDLLPVRNKDRSFHYAPYKTDSGFEQKFLEDMFTLEDGGGVKLLDKYGLEIYYNGDRALTEFRICCYKKTGARMDYIGTYTPDFLVVSRRGGEIHRAVMVETKGRAYADDPNFIARRAFVEEHFTPRNNRAFGYNRFEYLCLEDSLPENERIAKTHRAITAFFGEGGADA